MIPVQTDINDKPPDPSQLPSDARMQPRPKVLSLSATQGYVLFLNLRSFLLESCSDAQINTTAQEW